MSSDELLNIAVLLDFGRAAQRARTRSRHLGSAVVGEGLRPGSAGAVVWSTSMYSSPTLCGLDARVPG